MFVEEKGTLEIRDSSGKRIATVETFGYYPYRTALLTGSVTPNLALDATYSGEGDNHRVYKTKNGWCTVSDNFVRWGTGVVERSW